MAKGDRWMAQIGYNETVMDHFMNPRNVGVIENPDGYGKVGPDRRYQVQDLWLRLGHSRLQYGHGDGKG